MSHRDAVDIARRDRRRRPLLLDPGTACAICGRGAVWARLLELDRVIVGLPVCGGHLVGDRDPDFEILLARADDLVGELLGLAVAS